MRAVLCHGTEAEVAEARDPSPAPDEVVVAVEACGLCGSDVHSLQNGEAADGQILGHEFSGRIAARGRDVTGWAEGQPVAASPLGSCGKCRICARGLNFRCPAAPNIGINRQGAYAQYVAVPARQLVALPRELPVELGAHAEPLSVGSQAVKLSGAGAGDPVLVFGVGPIGLYAIMALRLAGAGPIVAAGRSAGRREAAADVGADVVLDTRSRPVREWAEESGTKFAAALECSAAPGAFGELLDLLEPGGTCVEVALTPEEARVPLFGMLSEGLHLVGSCAFSDETYRESVDHLVAGRVPADRLISERVPLDGTPDALVRLRTPGTLVRILSRPWD
ncbi:MAG: alcohol dehydrogenase catalytic domain-containing protein [Nocardiopsaceae bacterium]|nr:alcohol dehydrogenase catalytic domain-containing protein [Nocardiopsaceae bacterium]